MDNINKAHNELNKYKEELFNKPVGEVLNNDFCNTFDCYENYERCWKKILDS